VSESVVASAAEVVRRARLAAGLTQAQLAERAGVTQSVISAYESGGREPALSTLSRLVVAAGMRLDLQITAGEGGRAPRALPAHGLGGRVRRLRRQVLRLVAAHGGTGVGLFGSAARGDDRPDSDVDLLVALPDDISLLELGRLTEELEALLGARVDVVPDRSVKPAVRARINQDLVPL
jgi:predicted nucleotidyltransferase/DNA-binding XRE family transcriptional regulator